MTAGICRDPGEATNGPYGSHGGCVVAAGGGGVVQVAVEPSGGTSKQKKMKQRVSEHLLACDSNSADLVCVFTCALYCRFDPA